MNRSNERKWFHTKKMQEADDTLQKPVTDVDYTNDLALLVNTSV